MSTIGEYNLARLAETAFERRGDHPALLFEGRTLGSAEMFERGLRIAGGLIELGVAPGDRVIVSMANCPEVGILYNAIWRAGAVVTPAMFLLAEEDLRHQIADSGATVVCTTPEFEEKVRSATRDLPGVRAIVTTGEAGDGVRALSELERADAIPIVARGDDDLAALLYTGGTTGRAKGVMLTHANLHFTGAAAHQTAYVPGITRGLGTLPLSHAYGILVTISGLHNPEPGFAVLLRWFDPVAIPRLIEEHGLQIAAFVPSMFQILLGQPLEDHDLSSWQHASSGGAPLAPETAAEFGRRVPSVEIRQGYGLTETGALISANPVGGNRTGSVGLPVPGCEVVIVDDEGQPVPPGQPGEITARSPGVMQGYWNAPDATAEALRDGRLYTGDIGYRDGDGYLYIVDRKKDLIIRGGFNVYPRDVEDALLEHPAVTVAGVVGQPHERHGEEVVAFVSLSDGAELTTADLVAWARERIGGYKYPREVHIVDTVPLTPVGKIDRKALRAQLAS